MIRNIEEGHIDKELFELSAQRIIDIKNRITISPRSNKNFTELVKGHLNLVEEMNFYST